MMIGMNRSRSISDTAAAPHADAIAAVAPAGAITRQSSGILRANVTTAAPVPNTAVILFVASAAWALSWGATTRIAGSKIKPPPPTTASTHPAANAATINNPQSAAAIRQTQPHAKVQSLAQG